jgi:hypothetical protein
MSLDAAELPFAAATDTVEELFEIRTGWTITVDSGVTHFDVTGQWEEKAWLQVLSDIVDSAGLCLTLDSGAREIEVSECP